MVAARMINHDLLLLNSCLKHDILDGLNLVRNSESEIAAYGR